MREKVSQTHTYLHTHECMRIYTHTHTHTRTHTHTDDRHVHIHARVSVDQLVWSTMAPWDYNLTCSSAYAIGVYILSTETTSLGMMTFSRLLSKDNYFRSHLFLFSLWFEYYFRMCFTINWYSDRQRWVMKHISTNLFCHSIKKLAEKLNRTLTNKGSYFRSRT